MTKIPFIWSEHEEYSGADFNLIYKKVKKDSEGLDITGGVNYFVKDSKGVKLGGLANIVEGYSRGLNFSGVMNYARKADGFLIQYGTLSNLAHETSENDFVLQIGLFNQIEDKYSFIINVKGLENLPKKFKKLFSKKNIEKKVLKVQIKRYIK